MWLDPMPMNYFALPDSDPYIAGDMQRRNEAFARANPQNFRNMPSHYKQVEEWQRAFVRQRSRVASGGARDLRDGSTANARPESCSLWSLRLMPFCR